MAGEHDFIDEDLDPEYDFSDEGAEFQESADAALFSRASESGAVDELSSDDLEEAYLQALAAMETAEWAISEPGIPNEVLAAAELASEPATLEPTGVEIAGTDFLGGSVGLELPTAVETTSSEVGTESPVDSRHAKTKATPVEPAQDPSLKPLRVIEACLFVGGLPLSAKKLAGLLDGNNEASDIESLIDELSLEYSAQGRPYEIRLGDGGYKVTLRAEFETIRSRVYGVGPRDVKLSQDALEVLALVAYQQPITPAAIEACKPNSANILRQLLRRELISLNRIDQQRNGVEYHTTPRFLQLFGLAQLNELPRPEDLSIR